MPETQKPKPWWKSKTVWLGVLTAIAGAGQYAGVAPHAAPAILAASGIAGIVLRTVTKQPLSATAPADDEAK
jgi:hypothetical protein